jgi:hypothetical protein
MLVRISWFIEMVAFSSCVSAPDDKCENAPMLKGRHAASAGVAMRHLQACIDKFSPLCNPLSQILSTVRRMNGEYKKTIVNVAPREGANCFIWEEGYLHQSGLSAFISRTRIGTLGAISGTR